MIEISKYSKVSRRVWGRRGSGERYGKLGTEDPVCDRKLVAICRFRSRRMTSRENLSLVGASIRRSNPC